MTETGGDPSTLPRTDALRRALRRFRDHASASDLLFLEAWEASPCSEPGIAFRVHQIRRANPELAAQIRDELSRRRAAG